MAIGFKEIDEGLLLNIQSGDLEKAVKQYNKNNKAVEQRIKGLQNFADELEYSLGSEVAKNLVITPKVAGYSRFTNKEGFPKFPEVELRGTELYNKDTGKKIKPSEFQSFIWGQNSFYTDEANSTKLAGVNGVYYNTAQFLNYFLPPSQQINMKAYRFQGSTRERALKDIKNAISRLTSPEGDYKLIASDLDRKDFWTEWNIFKDNFGSNVYRKGSSKQESVAIFARDFYTPTRRPDLTGGHMVYTTPAKRLKDMGFKNFTQYLEYMNSKE